MLAETFARLYVLVRLPNEISLPHTGARTGDIQYEVR